MLHISPKSFLKSSSRLGDPWMDRWARACIFRLRLLFPHLADRPRGAQQPATLGDLREFLSHFVSIHLFGRFWFEIVGRTIRPLGPDCPWGADYPQWAREPSEFWRVHTGGSVSFFRLSALVSQTIHHYHADCPAGHRRLSTWDFSDRLCPLLL
jgi:hypothetical protein